MRRKTLDNNAISAVIGVILMVAITVAMAAVAYAYFTGMIGGQKEAAPVISFTPSQTDKTIVVDSADVGINWNTLSISISNTTGHTTITRSGIINAGDKINLLTDPSPVLHGTVTVTIIHVPSNSLLGTYTIENV